MRQTVLENEIFNVSEDKFNELALKIFSFQRNNCEVYSKWANLTGPEPKDFSRIPFLPISFFKNQKVMCKGPEPKIAFESSSTSGTGVSKHFVPFPDFYEINFQKTFHQFYGDPHQYCILALLPSYLERENSSLVYMAKHLIDKAKAGSGFYLNNRAELMEVLLKNEKSGQKKLLLGVTYSLLDLAEEFGGTELTNTLVMETGGMKGKRQELTREEVHKTLCETFGLSAIHSEYGMTELMSQAYSIGKGVFRCPPWMKVQIQDINDPGLWLEPGKRGRICIADFGNLYSCSFIATDDLGKMNADGSFEVLGRLDFSDTRGCNLMLG